MFVFLMVPFGYEKGRFGLFLPSAAKPGPAELTLGGTLGGVFFLFQGFRVWVQGIGFRALGFRV